MINKKEEHMPEAADNATLIFTNNESGVWKQESGVMSPPLRQLRRYLGRYVRVDLIGDLSAFGLFVRVDYTANLVLRHCAIYKGQDMSAVKPRDVNPTELKGKDIVSVFLCSKNCAY
ncbi:uncharacterized protein DMAD_02058 [Drosophila madeirensis]|uniref:LSM domain-containing protein n=1 Tax=Drosophila madeirensis TaxID=30013 RepID=A0AAU9G3V8_DROMD